MGRQDVESRHEASQSNPALRDYIFTSESVSEGHPDKLCDQISDAIVDRFLSEMPEARTAVETTATTNFVGLIGEVRSRLHHQRSDGRPCPPDDQKSRL